MSRTARVVAAAVAVRAARRFVVPIVALLAAAALGLDVRAQEPPRPRAGIVPLELSQVAKASGPELRLSDPDMTLAGKRVRFLADGVQTERTAAGEDVLVLTGDDARVVFRLPGPLENPERLTAGQEWEVIARLDREVKLADGRSAIAVMPDLLVKTPGLPSEEKPTDVIARVAGETFLVDPPLTPYESSEPVYRLRVTDPGRGLERDFIVPGPSAIAAAKDDQGRTMYNAIRTDRAEDGREKTTSCIFRNEGGRLRNVAYGEVVIDQAGNRSDEVYVDLEREQFNDTWSARKRDFEPNTYVGTCLGVAIAGFPQSARVVRFYVWGGSGIPVPVYAYVDGEETLEVRGRPERARRIRVGLDVRQAARSIDVPEVWRQHAESAGEVWFSGETTYWISTTPPYDMLRFEGALGPPGSPEVVIERIR
ncbi:MAG TPA: hypothetical protein VIS07_16270 [Candidatus Binatia bacterium]